MTEENALVEEVEEPTASEEVVEETPVATDEQVEAAEEAAEELDEKPPKGRDAESRIKELNWHKKQAEAEAQRWRELYLEKQQDSQPEPEPPKEPEIDYPDAPVPPDRFNFDSDQDYNAAVQGFQKEQAQYFRKVARLEQETAARQQQEQTRRQYMSERQLTLAQKLDAGRTKYHDFDMVYSNPSVQYSETMIQSLVDADNTSEIAYHFGNNPEEANKIAAMQPIQQIMAIAKLDQSLAAQTKKTTKAPPPSEPLTQGNTAAVVDPDKLSVDEWRRLRDEGKI